MTKFYRFALALCLGLLTNAVYGQAPANDECANAISVTVQTPGSVSYTAFDTRMATRSPNNPVCTSSSGNDDIWYSFVATDTIVTLAYRNVVLDGPSSGMGYQFIDGCGGANIQCEFTSPLDANGAYEIAIRSEDGSGGFTIGDTYQLRIFAQNPGGQATGEFALVGMATNDDCDQAEVFMVSAAGACAFTTVSTRYTSRSLYDPECTGSSANDDVWYTFTATSTSQLLSFENLTLSPGSGATSGLGYSLSLVCPDGTVEDLECDFSIPADGGAGEQLIGTDGLVVGQAYTLRLFLQGGRSYGTVDVCLQDVNCTPPDAQVGSIFFATCATDGTPTLEVEITSLGSAASVTINNSGGAAPVLADAIGTYTVGPFASEGLHAITLEHDTDASCNVTVGNFFIICRDENNACADAVQATVNPPGDATNAQTVTNRYGTNSAFPNDPSCGNYQGGDLWYTFTPVTPSIDVVVTESDWSTFAATVYTNDCAAGTEVVCDSVRFTGTFNLDNLTPNETYLLRIYDFANNDIGPVTFSLQSDISLPATLVDFAAEARGKANVVTWVTEAERGVSEFVLEAATDADPGEWYTVGTMSAANAGQTERAYEIVDSAPGRHTYYRLTTLDYDGSTALSEVVSVVRDRGAALAEAVVSPNPTPDVAQVRFSPVAAALQLRVLDLTGRVVRESRFSGATGRVEADLRGLAKGVYILRLEDGRDFFTTRIVKQ